MAKKHGTFKEKIKNPPIFFIKNVSYRQKRHKRAIHVDFSRYRYDNIETRPTPTKRIQFNPFVVKSVSESNCKISVKMQYDRTSTSYLTRRWNMNLPFSDATILTKIMNKEISVYKVLHLCLNNVWEAGAEMACISRNSGAFRIAQATDTNPLLEWSPTSRSSSWPQ